jgi:hypothetical protein
VDFELHLRPFRMRVAHQGRKPGGAKLVSYAPFALPDSLYRQAARRVIQKLIDENRALRRQWSRPPSKSAVALVWILEHALKKANWRRSA